jgi:hypothetical protein
VDRVEEICDFVSEDMHFTADEVLAMMDDPAFPVGDSRLVMLAVLAWHLA